MPPIGWEDSGLLFFLLFLTTAALFQSRPKKGSKAMSYETNQRVVIGVFDGLGMDYFSAQPLPTIQQMAVEGFFKPVKALMPSVTNTNNASICCGAYPAEHGITGNSYFNEQTGEAEYMEHADFVCVPTLIQRAAVLGLKSALLTSKKKTLNLLARSAAIAVAAEEPAASLVARYGAPANIYSCEINYWLWEVAIDLLKQRPDIRVLYVHTTDFPMHTWAPAEAASQEHLSTLDRLLGMAVEAAPDAAFLLTADHGMNYKRRCWDLGKACAVQDVNLRFVLSVEKDRYVKHHRTFGGIAWVWLRSSTDADRVMKTIEHLQGVEQVLTRSEAASLFHLMPERIGDLAVLGDKDTVFGDLDTEMELLDAGYRSHGSLHEVDVPLIIYNQSAPLPAPEKFMFNADLTCMLYR
jgi:phosphonoacetate hydrolase